jgi:hypothetical protein
MEPASWDRDWDRVFTGSKEEPVGFVQKLYRKSTAEYGDGNGITAKDVGPAKQEEDKVAKLLLCLGLE